MSQGKAAWGASAPAGKLFGQSGLEGALAAVVGRSAEERVSHVVAAAAEFRQSLPRQDDITVLALLRHASESSSPSGSVMSAKAGQ